MTIDINSLGQMAGSLLAICSFLGLSIHWLIVKPIKTYIDLRTNQIQPTSNGGKSLPDAVEALKRVENKLDELHFRVESLERKKRA
jgi:hypothetical protein